MPQKALIRVTMTDSKKSGTLAITRWVCLLGEKKKSRTEAMKIAATFSGVESVSIKGDNKDEIEVIGDRIDTVGLARLLRKNVGHADLLSVGPVKEDKEDEKKPPEEKKNEATVVPLVGGSIPYYPYPQVLEVRDYNHDFGCSIL